MSISILFFISIAGFLGHVHWTFDLFSHFRMQYFILSLLSLVILFVSKNRFFMFIGIITLSLNFYTLYPYYLSKPQVKSSHVELSLMTHNLLTSNRKYSEVIANVESFKPDILFLAEVNNAWVSHLNRLKKLYPYSMIEAREDNFGVALFSKLPLQKSEILFFTGLPSLHVVVEKDGKFIDVIGTHPYPPLGKYGSDRRDKHLEELSHFCNTLHGSKIVMGDLNTSPFSFHFQRLIAQTSLHDSALGFGLVPTWSSTFALLAVKLDYILVSNDISVINHQVGNTAGSDHSMVFATVGM
ncbi:MAG: endonuclease/exonuclease/phosphatase family protein [Epsilonproteobacteria bacterium]|nr:endonuclease/exonuclease/phosphatase family protein [Campylobacterota bacterium]